MSVKPENILPNGRYHIRCQRPLCFYLLGGYSGLCTSLDIKDGSTRVASVTGEIEVINRKNGVVLFRHANPGQYLSLVYDCFGDYYAVSFSSVSNITWEMAEFELITSNKCVPSNCFFIRSIKTGYYLRIKEDQSNNATAKIQMHWPDSCSADVNEQTKATLFLFESRFVEIE